MSVEVEIEKVDGFTSVLEKQVLPQICGLASLVMTEIFAKAKIEYGEPFLITLPNGTTVGDLDKVLTYFADELLAKTVAEMLIKDKQLNIINIIDLIWVELKKVKVEKLVVH